MPMMIPNYYLLHIYKKRLKEKINPKHQGEIFNRLWEIPSLKMLCQSLQVKTKEHNSIKSNMMILILHQVSQKMSCFTIIPISLNSKTHLRYQRKISRVHRLGSQVLHQIIKCHKVDIEPLMIAQSEVKLAITASCNPPRRSGHHFRQSTEQQQLTVHATCPASSRL